jgi:hypothetical protein
MSEEIQRSRGRPQNFKQDRGGVATEFGPFTAVVKNNVDPTRSGRLQVFIKNFNSGADESDNRFWTTVRYLPGFYGATPPGSAPDNTVGGYLTNQSSYGMWMTPPDIGITVVVVFVNGDRDLGYYIGAVPDQGTGHMIPAIGGSANYQTDNKNQETYYVNSTLLPVTEINTDNPELVNSARFFDQKKPVHAVVAGAMFQQGLNNDRERGPIRSSSQRESPSRVFGISTPGIPVYQGGLKPNDIAQKIASGEIQPADAQVIGRMGGHTLVMDDGDQNGENALFRLRTPKGHQITMNDSGNFFYITHANGQTWLEFGQEGTVDVFSTNSINMRTQGDINFHADRDINMFAGGNIQVKSTLATTIESVTDLSISAQKNFKVYSKDTIGVKADGSLALQSATGSWNGGESLLFTAGGIDLNGPAAPAVTKPAVIITRKLDDTSFSTAQGWTVATGNLESIVNRAPTHEPYPYHNKGVNIKVNLEPGQPSPPPGAVPVPAGVVIRAK